MWQRIFAESLLKANDIGFKGPTSDNGIMPKILNTVLFWSGIAAVAAIIAGGFFYVISQGNPENVRRAKNAVLGAVVGLVIIAFAFVIVNFVIGAAK